MKPIDPQTTPAIAPSVASLFTVEEILALLEVANDLESGEIPIHRFEMDELLESFPCGTVACLAGWACMKMGMTTRDQIVDWYDSKIRTEDYFTRFGVVGLFNPWRRLIKSSTYNDPVVAANAVRTYIRTGTPDWGTDYE